MLRTGDPPILLTSHDTAEGSEIGWSINPRRTRSICDSACNNHSGTENNFINNKY